MKVLVVLLAVACASGQVLLPLGTPLPHTLPDAFPASQFHGQGEGGQFSFGHSSVQQTRSEVRLPSGQVLGHYSYVDPNGEPAITYYQAGPDTGYRVVGSNRLPEAPEADLQAPVDEGVPPEPVQYTSEVAKARADFAEKFEEVKKGRTKRNVFLPNLFTDMKKVANGEQVAIYTRDDPSWAYAFTTQPQAQPTLKTTAGVPLVYSTFPFVPLPVKPAEEKVTRSKRSTPVVPLPYVHVAPVTGSATFTTSQFEPVEGKTPADTTKLDLVTKEHKVQFPSYSLVQPVVQGKPLTYSTLGSPFVASPFVGYPYVHTPFVPVKSD